MAQRWFPIFFSTLSLVSFASGCGRESTSAPAQPPPRPDEIVPAEAPKGAYPPANTASQQSPVAATFAVDAPTTSMTEGPKFDDGKDPASASDSSTVGPLNDAQIAGITKAANGSEIDQAKLAHAKAKKRKTREFAELMISHHQAAEQAQAKLSIREANSPIVTQLDIEAASTMSKLNAASNSDFDRTYIDAQVDAHRNLLSLIDNQLLPNAKGAGLRAYLEQMKTKVEMHLKKAEDTRQELGESATMAAKGQGVHLAGDAAAR